ncbi:MAG: Hsp20/alpha crystallin family protein [Opitutales bacterium]
MHTIIQPTASRSLPLAERTSARSDYRQPNFDCREQPDAVKLVVYVPGVEGSGVELEVRGPDFVVTARKPHVVRVNWQALQLESAQRDYRLRLRLGHGLDYSALHAELHNGVLTLVVPKRTPAATPAARMLNVA